MDTDETEVIVLPEEGEVETSSSKQMNVDELINSINEKLSLDDATKQTILELLTLEKPEFIEFLKIIDHQLVDKIEDEKLVEDLKLYNEELKSQKVELEINFGNLFFF